MSAQFTVDTERIQAASGDIARISSEIDSQVTAMMARLTGLQGAWTGTASARFQALVGEWQGTQKQVRASLDSIGAVLAANPLAAQADGRNAPSDTLDLNRSFPGRPRGSLTSRLADTLFREVIRKSDFGIDLHTAGGERTNYPQVRADLSNSGVAELAQAFGCPLMIDGAGPEGSLRRVAVEAGVPTVVYEAGSPRRLEKPFIAVGIAGVLNVLRHLKMMPGEPVSPPLRFAIGRTHWVRARAGGILDLKVDLGQPLRRGQAISVNTNPFGRERSQLKAPHAGIVLGLTQLPLVHPGDAICHIARLEPREIEAWREYWDLNGRIRP